MSGVVFDLDGTLVDHDAASLTGLEALLTTLAVEHLRPADVAADWHRLEERHWVEYRAGRLTFQEQRRARLRDFLPHVSRALPENRYDEIFDAYLAGYEAGWVAFDDAVDALTRVQQLGLPVVVLTNGEQEQQEAKARAAGLAELCGGVLASSSLPNGKPHPEAYAAACAELAVPPAGVLMVGDNYELDVLAPREAGLQAVHLDRSGTHETPDARRVRTLAELTF